MTRAAALGQRCASSSSSMGGGGEGSMPVACQCQAAWLADGGAATDEGSIVSRPQATG